MKEAESNSLKYLSGAFRVLSADKKDSVLEAARSLLKIQENHDLLITKAVPYSEREDFEFFKFASSHTCKKQ